MSLNEILPKKEAGLVQNRYKVTKEQDRRLKELEEIIKAAEYTPIGETLLNVLFEKIDEIRTEQQTPVSGSDATPVEEKNTLEIEFIKNKLLKACLMLDEAKKYDGHEKSKAGINLAKMFIEQANTMMEVCNETLEKASQLSDEYDEERHNLLQEVESLKKENDQLKEQLKQTPVSGSVSNLPNVDSSQVIPSNPRFIKESKSK